MKGVILAGGLGTRLRPATNIINKHLLNVYNRPMIYYPLQNLIDGGCKEIMIVTGEENAGMFVDLLKDGREFGVKITYAFQHGAGGIADALKIAAPWIGDDTVAVILGDNYFDRCPWLGMKINKRTRAIFIQQRDDAQRFGVFNTLTRQIVEKPVGVVLGMVVTGCYIYQGRDLSHLKNLKPSARGELEITDFNNHLLKILMVNRMKVENLAGFWSDMGTPDSLLATATRIKSTLQ
jgi:glucose-1-phosphate thymidylyltransferase